MSIKTISALRYVTPLREGGSLPAVVEGSDGAMYVMKFVGAGQGRKALIAELIAGEIARTLGLHVPEMAFMELDPALGPSEPDPEIYDLLRMSVGLNLGFRYLPKAFAYSALLQPPPSGDLASGIVWFDAYMTNVDRTAQNTNILLWQKGLWLIDHGACLYFHHDWKNYMDRSRSTFPAIKNHVLLRFASVLDQADASLRPRLTVQVLRDIVDLVPDVWLVGEPGFAGPAEARDAYFAYLTGRLESSQLFVQEARHARTQLV